MAGLPHYKNSTASMNNFEPLYKSMFEVQIVPPPSVGDFKLVLENVKKVSMEEMYKLPETVQQKYKFATRTYSGGSFEKTSFEITISFEVNLNDNNSAYVFKALRKWTDLIYDPLTGRMGLKKDYVGGPMIISFFNKNFDIYQQIKCPVIFPVTPLKAMEGDYSSNDIYVIEEFKFVADYFEEVII
jgi:hypothetical protein